MRTVLGSEDYFLDERTALSGLTWINHECLTSNTAVVITREDQMTVMERWCHPCWRNPCVFARLRVVIYTCCNLVRLEWNSFH